MTWPQNKQINKFKKIPSTLHVLSPTTQGRKHSRRNHGVRSRNGDDNPSNTYSCISPGGGHDTSGRGPGEGVLCPCRVRNWPDGVSWCTCARCRRGRGRGTLRSRPDGGARPRRRRGRSAAALGDPGPVMEEEERVMRLQDLCQDGKTNQRENQEDGMIIIDRIIIIIIDRIIIIIIDRIIIIVDKIIIIADGVIITSWNNYMYLCLGEMTAKEKSKVVGEKIQRLSHSSQEEERKYKRLYKREIAVREKCLLKGKNVEKKNLEMCKNEGKDMLQNEN